LARGTPETNIFQIYAKKPLLGPMIKTAWKGKRFGYARVKIGKEGKDAEQGRGKSRYLGRRKKRRESKRRKKNGG